MHFCRSFAFLRPFNLFIHILFYFIFSLSFVNFSLMPRQLCEQIVLSFCLTLLLWLVFYEKEFIPCTNIRLEQKEEKRHFYGIHYFSWSIQSKWISRSLLLSLSLSLGMCVDGVWLRVYFCMLAYVYARWYNAIKITNPLNATLQQIAWTTLFFM